MKRISLAFAGLSALILMLPELASAAPVGRNMRAYPVNDAVFEVIARTAGGSNDYWCGAADYAQRVLGAPWAAQIYVARGRGPSVTTGRRTAVQFTLDAATAGVTPRGKDIVLSRLQPGDHMSVQQAKLYCGPAPVRP